MGATPSRAEPQAPPPLATPATSDSFLTPKLERILKESMKVVEEKEGVVSAQLPGNRSLANQTPILFFRKKGIRLEMIATGKVIGEERSGGEGKWLLKVELDKDAIAKYPRSGDFAAPMSESDSLAEGDKKDQFDFLRPEEADDFSKNRPPGYLEGGSGLFWGKMDSTGTQATAVSALVNESKQSTGYRFAPVHLAYFSNYIPIGVEYESYSGNFPTRTYQGVSVNSPDRVSWFGLVYRFPLMLNRKFELQLRALMLKDQFHTENTDESLISTDLTGTGFGFRTLWLRRPSLWAREPGQWPLQLQSAFLDFTFFPSLTAKDLTVSRGTESPGSNGYQIRAGATVLAWLPFIPFFKRWFVEGSIGYRYYSLGFSGPTKPADAVIQATVDQNSKATESAFDARIIFGIRIEDPLKLIFNPNREAKK